MYAIGMTNRAVFIAAGPDRHGWVDEVSKYLFERGGNLEDSRMARLAGQFALMAIVTGPVAAMEAIRSDLDQLRSAADIMAEVRQCPDGLPVQQADEMVRPNQRLYLLRASGADQVGVMHQLSHLLRSLHINIENVHTRIVRGPAGDRSDQGAWRAQQDFGGVASGGSNSGPSEKSNSGSNGGSQPGSGDAQAQFEMDMIVDLPAETPVSKLREYVGHLWSGRGISWELSGVTAVSDGAD